MKYKTSSTFNIISCDIITLFCDLTREKQQQHKHKQNQETFLHRSNIFMGDNLFITFFCHFIYHFDQYKKSITRELAD